MRISDWSSDVCSSDLREDFVAEEGRRLLVGEVVHAPDEAEGIRIVRLVARREVVAVDAVGEPVGGGRHLVLPQRLQLGPGRAGAGVKLPFERLFGRFPLSALEPLDRTSVVSGRSVRLVEISVDAG